MISIYNVSKSKTDNAMYELYINERFICSFRHKRSDGLATCLKKASEAVDKRYRVTEKDK